MIILLFALLQGGCPEYRDDPDDGEYSGPPPENVSLYIRTWNIPGGGKWNAAMIRGGCMSELIIAFALINTGDYSLYISDSFPNLWNEVAALKEQYPHLRVNISVGGGSESGLAGFSEMAGDPALRSVFTANVCNWLETHNLDGVDIDWEYPVGPPWDSVRHLEDRENYITLLREIRDALDALGEQTGKRYGLSTAIPASSWFITANDVKAAAQIVDGLKLMAYDYYGDWGTPRTGHNAALYRNPDDPANWSTDQAVKAYLNAQVPPEKIVLGIAFYGQAWDNVPQGPNANTPGLYQTGSNTKFYTTLAWSDIQKDYLKPGSGYTRYWDKTAKAPFLYNGSRWISYTDHEQVRAITGYVKEKNLGGVFVWEYGHDMGGELLNTLARNSEQ